VPPFAALNFRLGAGPASPGNGVKRGLKYFSWLVRVRYPKGIWHLAQHGGWGFNDDIDSGYVKFVNNLRTHVPPPVLTNSVIQTNAFFDMSVDTAMFTKSSSGRDYAAANRNRILSDAIPVLTLPIGANYVTNLDERAGGTVNFNMNTSQFQNGWPARAGFELGKWHHSDIRDVAYPYNYKFFNQVVDLGNLK